MKNTLIKKATVLFVLVSVIMTLTTGCNAIPESLDLASMIAPKESMEVMNNDLSNTNDTKIQEQNPSIKTLASYKPKEESMLDSKAEGIKTKPEVKESKVEPLKTKIEPQETKAEIEVKENPTPKTESKEVEQINSTPAVPIIQEEPEVEVQEAPVSIPEDSFVESEGETDSDADSSKPQEHTHTWITETIHHDAKTHEETVTETIHHDAEYETKWYVYFDDGSGAANKTYTDDPEWDNWMDISFGFAGPYPERIETTPGWDEEVTKTVTITDSPAWEEVISRCSECGCYY